MFMSLVSLRSEMTKELNVQWYFIKIRVNLWFDLSVVTLGSDPKTSACNLFWKGSEVGK